MMPIDKPRWAVIEEARELKCCITDYEEVGRKVYRWRWLANWMSYPRFVSFKCLGSWWFVRTRIEPVAAQARVSASTIGEE